MKTHIFTGNYKECKHGNLISISGDRGSKVEKWLGFSFAFCFIFVIKI